jgi:hypothetical protein
VLAVRQRTPTTAKAPSSKIAGMRLTMSDPNPITVTSAEMRRGTQTRSKARTMTSVRSLRVAVCS